MGVFDLGQSLRATEKHDKPRFINVDIWLSHNQVCRLSHKPNCVLYLDVC